LPRDLQDRFPAEGTQLSRYAVRLSAVEINSSFYRTHRQATYARWAASVGPDFLFAVKLPKAITHERRLIGSDDMLRRFADEVSGLGEKLGPVLIQLPPSLVFEARTAEAFVDAMRTALPTQAVIEPRHPSWFADIADALLVEHRIARVAADPPPVPEAVTPGGWRGFTYYRLHGAPRIYWSDYGEDAIAAQARSASRAAGTSETWVIYDNTASGAAAGNALALADLVQTRDSIAPGEGGSAGST
jgi:uncharacterized protein YecE (DUF72 family)